MATTETRQYRGYDIVPMRQWSQWCVGIYPNSSSKPDFQAMGHGVVDRQPTQSPATLMTTMPVILPSVSKPNRRLAASPRGNISFTS